MTNDHHAGAAAEKAEQTAAVALWVIVSIALLYGVSETAVRVAQLFG
jgi:hypothetical protein